MKRRTGNTMLSAGLALVLAGCAGGGAPIYVLHETEQPLRYRMSEEGSQSVETPNGPAGGGFETEAEMLLSIGSSVDGGRAFEVTFDEFRATLDGPMGARQVDGSSLTGRAFRGIVSPTGGIRMTERPEVTAGSYDQNNLVGMFPAILTPLPPAGAEIDEGWPHAWMLATGGGLEGESSYAGTARFAGDTTWNGIASRVIVSRGTIRIEGSGVPEGSPGEVDLNADGESITTYVWDPSTGVLLGMRSETSADGAVSTMGFDLPLEIRSAGHVELVR